MKNESRVKGCGSDPPGRDTFQLRVCADLETHTRATDFVQLVREREERLEGVLEWSGVRYATLRWLIVRLPHGKGREWEGRDEDLHEQYATAMCVDHVGFLLRRLFLYRGQCEVCVRYILSTSYIGGYREVRAKYSHKDLCVSVRRPMRVSTQTRTQTRAAYRVHSCQLTMWRALATQSHVAVGGRGISGQFLNEIPPHCVIDSRDGCSNVLIADKQHLFYTA